MNQRVLCATAIILLTISVRGETRQRYLVATRTAGLQVSSLAFGDHELAERGYKRFSSVEGYALELTEAEALTLSQRADVRYVEPDRERWLNTRPHLDVAQEVTYGVSMVNAPMVWPLTRGEGVRVGVIDTGIDLRHPDLQTAYRGGWDFIHGDAIPEEEAEGGAVGHGTRMAGLIAATNNQFGVVGVSPGVALYALKIFGKSGGSRTSDVIRALDWAIANDLDIVNCSFGGEPTKLEEEAFARARRAGVLVIAAVGNHGTYVRSPAAYSSVIAVGAIDRSMRVASFSNRGPELDFVAPGVDVISAFLTGRGKVGTVTLEDSTVLSAYPFEYSRSELLSGPWIDCFLGYSGDFQAGAGKIALVDRGGNTPADKVRNALNNQTLAVIVVNDAGWDSPMRGTLGSGTQWPVAVSVSPTSGELIRKAGGMLTIDSYTGDYEASDGCSLSAPIVAGVAALILALRPDLSTDEVVELLRQTAHDLGDPGCDPIYGCGLVDAYAAARIAVPHAFPPRRRAVRR